MLESEHQMRRREEIERTLERVRSWPAEDQAALIEGLLTPELRMRLILEEVRRHVRAPQRKIDRVVDQAVRRIRRERATSR